MVDENLFFFFVLTSFLHGCADRVINTYDKPTVVCIIRAVFVFKTRKTRAASSTVVDIPSIGRTLTHRSPSLSG